MMDISRATTADIPALCSLLDALFSQEREFTPDRDAQQRGLSMIIGDSSVGNILVAREAGEVVRMVNLLYTVSTALGERVAWLEDMVVAKSVHGTGIGSALLDRATKHARESGCKRISLLTDHDNERAHRLYQRHGFIRSEMTTFRMLL